MGHLKETALTEPDLAKRMKLHIVGQATWPELGMSKRCKDCGEFKQTNARTGGGHCLKLKQFNGHARNTKPFNGADAHACRYLVGKAGD